MHIKYLYFKLISDFKLIIDYTLISDFKLNIYCPLNNDCKLLLESFGLILKVFNICPT